MSASTTTTTGYIITGGGFLPDLADTIRVTYTAQKISDRLNHTAEPGGDLNAQRSTSPATGALHITATDLPHRYRPVAMEQTPTLTQPS